MEKGPSQEGPFFISRVCVRWGLRTPDDVGRSTTTRSVVGRWRFACASGAHRQRSQRDAAVAERRRNLSGRTRKQASLHVLRRWRKVELRQVILVFDDRECMPLKLNEGWLVLLAPFRWPGRRIDRCIRWAPASLPRGPLAGFGLALWYLDRPVISPVVLSEPVAASKDQGGTGCNQSFPFWQKKPRQSERIALALGRTRFDRGSEPNYVRTEVSRFTFPLSIPHHSSDLKVGTTKSIVRTLIDDAAT